MTEAPEFREGGLIKDLFDILKDVEGQGEDILDEVD